MFVDWIKSLPGRPAAEDRGLPDPGRPVRRAGDRVDAEAARGARRADRVQLRSTRPTPPTSRPSPAQMAGKKPDLIAQGAVFEDGVGLVRSLKQLRLLAEDAVPDLRAEQRRPVQRRRRRGQHRGRLLHGQLERGREDAAERGVRRRATRRRTATRTRPRTPPTRSRRPQVLQAAVDRGRRDRPGQDPRLAARQRGADHPRPAELGRRPASRRASSCSRQWQSGKVEVVAPAEAADHRQTVVNPKPDWK